MKRGDPVLTSLLRRYYGLTVAEALRYKAKLDAGERLNAIELAEAQVVLARIDAWEASR